MEQDIFKKAVAINSKIQELDTKIDKAQKFLEQIDIEAKQRDGKPVELEINYNRGVNLPYDLANDIVKRHINIMADQKEKLFKEMDSL